MHIPDAYLSPATQATTLLIAAPIVALAAHKTRSTLSSKQLPMLSVGAAFCFAVQMFNIPAVGGTTAHALGTVLLAILLGPWAAMITLTLNLTVQALFFGDGGILSLGANVIDMAIVPSILGYGLYRLIVQDAEAGSSRSLIAAAIAAYVGTSVASGFAGFFLGLQPLIAHDGSGHALYFPFPWAVSVPAMLTSHLLVAAPAEAIITATTLAYLARNFPDLVASTVRAKVGNGLRLSRTLGIVLLLTPIGLIAGGDAWGEWDPEKLKELVGYVPRGAASSHELIKPVLPDYGLPNGHGLVIGIFGYIVSAIVGGSLVAVVIRALVMKGKRPKAIEVARKAPGSVLPDWLQKPNPILVVSGSTKKSWFEPLLSRLRSTMEETVVQERVARKNGWLQTLNPTLKAVVAIACLVAVSVSGQPAVLATIFALLLIGATSSKVPMGAYVSRVLGSVAFFGLILAVPVAFAAVTPGTTLLGSGDLAISAPGFHIATLLLSRLACGIGISLLWTTTTRWQLLLQSLRSLGAPNIVIRGLALAYRYLFVMVETLQEMVTARRSRQLGSIDKRQSREYAGAGAAILFAKSYAFTEEVHMAMRSRCYDLDQKDKRFKPNAQRFAVGAALGLLIIIGVSHVI